MAASGVTVVVVASPPEMAAAIFWANSFLTVDDWEAGAGGAGAAATGVAPGVLPLVEGLDAGSGFSDSETLDAFRSTKVERISLPVVGSMMAIAEDAFFSVWRYFTTGKG